jgi:hypothetical protein
MHQRIPRETGNLESSILNTTESVTRFELHARWIKPSIAGLIIAGAPEIAAQFYPALASQIGWLPWFTFIGLLLSALSLGVGLLMTDTVNARLLIAAFFALCVSAVIEAAYSVIGQPIELAPVAVIGLFCAAFVVWAIRRR